MRPVLPNVKGKAIVLGDHVDTDVLHPASHFSLVPEKVREGFLKHTDEAGATRDHTPSIIVAGVNFGCGSSRETSVRSFLLGGVRAVVASSMARIFYRSLWNLGLPALTCPGIADVVRAGQEMEIDVEKGLVRIEGRTEPLIADPIDPYFLEIARAGGLVAMMEEEGEKRNG